ncbi:MAG TPA: hypothetical protein VF756_14095 [Thermoanaerobaculia bacterium]
MLKRAALVSVLTFLTVSAAWAQPTQHGVGFDPFPGKPDPFATQPFDQSLFYERYGYYSYQWERMPGMIAEMFFVNEIALRNACRAGALGDPLVWDCQPTLREQQDLAATERRPARNGNILTAENFYCVWWFAYVYEGGTPQRAITVSRTDKPLGPFREASNPFWSCPVYYNNVAAPPPPPPPPPPPAPACQTDDDTGCLVNQRFKVEVTWQTRDGNSGVGHVVPHSDNSLLVWFFDQSNVEMLLKVLNACDPYGKFWVFYAATTNVEFTVTVTDTETGQVQEYRNAQGNAATPVQDTGTFTCSAGT